MTRRAKLTVAQVLEIRKLFRAGEKQTALAARFGVVQNHISAIVRYKRRKELEV
jgi:plasmid maintenance system antidote protein VapI